MTNISEKPLVLIVDDAPANIQVLAMCLQTTYRVKVAPSGERALAITNETVKPDLILLDIEMPDINGYEVCKTLKSQLETRDIPIIFVTGREEDSDEEYGLSLGAVDYITKPVRPAIVQARVNTHITIKQQRDKLAYIALHDQLTGLYNRHFLIEAAQKKLSLALRHDIPLSFLMIDIDYFKRINDNHSHATGDLVLKAIAKLINEHVREEDIAARLGGEEFVIVYGQCTAEQASEKANGLRKAIEELKPADLKVTVSIGIAACSERIGTFEALMHSADEALYKAKAAGRNRIIVSP